MWSTVCHRFNINSYYKSLSVSKTILHVSMISIYAIYFSYSHLQFLAGSKRANDTAYSLCFPCLLSNASKKETIIKHFQART